MLRSEDARHGLEKHCRDSDENPVSLPHIPPI